MREIKFRGWHTVKKMMFSAEEMAADQLMLLPTGAFINVSSDSTRLSQIYPRDKFIPLQFTGLKDKSGKKIYEGDVIQPCEADRNQVPREVYWDEGACQFRLSSRGGDKQFDKTSPLMFAKIGSIIGNIYEHPGLLK